MKIDQKYIWDYKIKSRDLKNPKILKWYLSRKINFGDWQSLDSKLVEKNLDDLDIDPILKQMLRNYYAYKRTKAHS